jgi:glycosyltransferase involved in cell wall biosynthesis
VKVVFVCFYEAYPPGSGAASVTYNSAKFAEGDRVLVQCAGEDQEPYTTEDGVQIITVAAATESRLGKMAGMNRCVRRLIDRVEELSPDVVVLEGAGWALYLWMLLREVRRRLPRTRIAYHSHNVEYVLRRQKHGRAIAVITRWAERRICREADLLFAVSSVDSAQLEGLYGVQPQLLPNGVDVDRFERACDDGSIANSYGIGDRACLFMGLYNYGPNRSAVDFLVGSVMPRIHQECPTAQLAILGGRVPYERTWLVNPGSIPYEQLPAFVCACKVGLAPIFSGSGTRVKILEYMAAGKPVVSTAKGAEGLEVQNGVNILLGEEESTFAAEVVRLLKDERLAGGIGAQGRETVRSRYSWSIVMETFNRALRQ